LSTATSSKLTVALATLLPSLEPASGLPEPVRPGSAISVPGTNLARAFSEAKDVAVPPPILKPDESLSKFFLPHPASTSLDLRVAATVQNDHTLQDDDERGDSDDESLPDMPFGGDGRFSGVKLECSTGGGAAATARKDAVLLLDDDDDAPGGGGDEVDYTNMPALTSAADEDVHLDAFMVAAPPVAAPVAAAASAAPVAAIAAKAVRRPAPAPASAPAPRAVVHEVLDLDDSDAEGDPEHDDYGVATLSYARMLLPGEEAWMYPHPELLPVRDYLLHADWAKGRRDWLCKTSCAGVSGGASGAAAAAAASSFLPAYKLWQSKPNQLEALLRQVNVFQQQSVFPKQQLTQWANRLHALLRRRT
jgi:hypothetical protein